MPNKIILIVFVLILMVAGLSCKKKKEELPLGIAVLIFPEQNSACISGSNISDTQSSVTFKWHPAPNATNYELCLKNLFTNVIKTFASNTNQTTLTLERNTPYTWYIISESFGASTKSEIWKFYNSGLAIISHAPFPSELISPSLGGTVSGLTVDLSWLGSDVDNDVVGYDIFFGSTTSPPLFKSDVTTSSLRSVSISAGNTYYWRVVSKDSQGNTANSALFDFKAN
jgi:hypothetical protein